MSFSINITILVKELFKACAAYIGGHFTPLKRDKELYEFYIKKLNSEDFINNTQDHIWAGKFVYEGVMPCFELLDQERNKEFHFIDQTMEKKRLALFKGLKKLFHIISTDYDYAGYNPAAKMTFYNVHKRHLEDNDPHMTKVTEIFNKVESLCDEIYISYEDFYNAGIRKYGERI